MNQTDHTGDACLGQKVHHMLLERGGGGGGGCGVKRERERERRK